MIGWRKVSKSLYHAFFDHVGYNQEKRAEHGMRKYKSDKKGFIGDPLDHLEEEIYDAMFYAYYSKGQRHHLLTLLSLSYDFMFFDKEHTPEYVESLKKRVDEALKDAGYAGHGRH